MFFLSTPVDAEGAGSADGRALEGPLLRAEGRKSFFFHTSMRFSVMHIYTI